MFIHRIFPRQQLPSWELLDKHKEISHIKFHAPGSASKLDSIVIYIKKNKNTYKTLRKQIWRAVSECKIQPAFSPMWNEVRAGFAEAAQPPYDGGSFGRYRCILIYYAFSSLRKVPGTHSFEDFERVLRDILPKFGISPDAPHLQHQISKRTCPKRLQREFFRLLALSKRKNPARYQRRSLKNRQKI